MTVDPATGACQVVGVVYAMTQVGGTWNPVTDGVVYAVAASSDGSKIFLGGGFTTVGGQARSRLAAVTSDTGQLVDGWTTTVKNNYVRVLAADSADRLYVGGSFGSIGGRAIARLAALSQSTGAVDTSFAGAPSDTVRALTLTDDGARPYAGGPFLSVSGVPRRGVAELDAASGSVTAFAPSDAGVAISMDVTPSGRLFFGTTSNRTYAYDPAVASTPVYRVRSGGDVQAILATDDEVYVGGHFTNFPEAKLGRVHLASFSTANGQLTSWNPGPNGSYGVWAIGLTRTPLSPNAVAALSIGGDFTRVAGASRRGYARFNF